MPVFHWVAVSGRTVTVFESAPSATRRTREPPAGVTPRNSAPPSEVVVWVATTAPVRSTSASGVEGAMPVTYTWRALPAAGKAGAVAADASMVASDPRSRAAPTTTANVRPRPRV